MIYICPKYYVQIYAKNELRTTNQEKKQNRVPADC